MGNAAGAGLATGTRAASGAARSSPVSGSMGPRAAGMGGDSGVGAAATTRSHTLVTSSSSQASRPGP